MTPISEFFTLKTELPGSLNSFLDPLRARTNLSGFTAQ